MCTSGDFIIVPLVRHVNPYSIFDTFHVNRTEIEHSKFAQFKNKFSYSCFEKCVTVQRDQWSNLDFLNESETWLISEYLIISK